MPRSASIPLDGSELRRRRIHAGLRQADLARTAGLSQRYVSEVERGVYNPTAPRLRKIADALGCDPADLLLAS